MHFEVISDDYRAAQKEIYRKLLSGSLS